MLIVFENTKGGVGKTTLAATVAVLLHELGHTVALLDADEQEHSARYVEHAEPAITVKRARTPKQILQAVRAHGPFKIAVPLPFIDREKPSDAAQEL